MAFSYNKKNLANTTITGAITSSDTSITVDDATVFPSGYFYATLMPSSEMSTFSNSEIVLVTNISSNTLTIARAQKNTAARAFSAGAIITNGVYTEDLDFAQSVGKKIFNAAWGGQGSPYYKITDDMLKVVPDEGTSIRTIFDTDYASGTARLSINESTSGVATVSGSNISITDAGNLAPVDVKLKGDTYQLTTTGKNKFDLLTLIPAGTTWSSNGITFNMGNDGVITVNGTASSSVTWTFTTAATVPSTGNTLVGECLSGTATTGGDRPVRLSAWKNWDGITYVEFNGAGVKTSAFSLTGQYDIWSFSVGAGAVVNNLKLRFMVQATDLPTSFEPYTGGTASPNPDYPQEVQTVTGTQTITINGLDYPLELGRNLFDTSLMVGYLDEDTGEVLTNTTSRVVSGFIPVAASTDYVLSALAATSGRTAQSSVYYYSDTAFISYVSWSNAPKTFTTPSGATRVRVVLRYDNSADVNSSSFTNIQLEKGSTATTYIAPIELCKLGDYQDYIYKSGEDWYIHKETAAYTFTGNENCGVWNRGVQCRFGDNTNPQSSLYNAGIEPIYYPQTTGKYPIYSDKAVAGAEIDTWYGHTRTVAYTSRENTNYAAILFSFGAGLADTKGEFLSILAGTRVVYIRAAATDTQITDATLISQLNALTNNKLYAGTNNIVVTGGLDGILEVQYYRAGSGVNLVPIVNGAYVADDNTRNVAPVKAGIPYDLTYHNGNWYVMNMVKKVTADDVDFPTLWENLPTATSTNVSGDWFGTVYTADFDGFISARVNFSATNGYAILKVFQADGSTEVFNFQINCGPQQAYSNQSPYLPVAKGMKFVCNDGVNGTSVVFRCVKI